MRLKRRGAKLAPNPAIRRKRIADAPAGHHAPGRIVAQDHAIAMQTDTGFIERDGDKTRLVWREVGGGVRQCPSGQTGGAKMDMHAGRVAKASILRRANLYIDALRWSVQRGLDQPVTAFQPGSLDAWTGDSESASVARPRGRRDFVVHLDTAHTRRQMRGRNQ